MYFNKIGLIKRRNFDIVSAMKHKEFLIGLIFSLIIGTNFSFAQIPYSNKPTLFVNAVEAQIGAPLPVGNSECDYIINAYKTGIGIDINSAAAVDIKSNHKSSLKKNKQKSQKSCVADLQKYFAAQGAQLPIPIDYRDYSAGDIVVFKIKSKAHFAVIAGDFNGWRTQNLVIHNNGDAIVKEDILRKYPIIAHYRFGL